MTKWIVGLLLLANLALFGWMQWGGLLTGDADAPALQPALNADKVRLLEWSAPAAVAAPSVPVTALTLSPAPAPEKSPAASCPAEWGEFSGADLARANQALEAMKLGNRLSHRIVEQDHGYWVYIPPLKNKAEVERKIEQLKARGVEEYYVVQTDGSWQNAISLGVFKTEDAAQKYLAFLRSRTVVSAKVGERASKLRFTVFVMRDLDAAEMARLVALQKEFPDSRLTARACGD